MSIPSIIYCENMRYLAFKYSKYLPIIFCFLLLPKSTYANVNVNISNNSSGSNSQVNIKNEVNSTTNTGSNTSNTKTDIRIETNGEVKEYHSTGNENIKIESGDSKNSVKINNIINEESKTQNSPTIIASKSAVAVNEIKKDLIFKNQMIFFLESIKTWFEKIHSRIFKL
jgi:hypothetical protein